MINNLISAILQILVFSSIPFLVYIIQKKSAKGFFKFLGLKKSTKKANLLSLLVVVMIVGPLLFLILTNEEFKAVMTDPDSVTGKIKKMGVGIEAITTIFIVAFFKTAFSEEIFFRGFLAKRLISATNFQTGNIIQAAVFGIIHALLFMSITENKLFLIIIFIFPAVGAYFKTYLNEKLANGSIIPGWIAHGTANLISYSLVLFIA